MSYGLVYLLCDGISRPDGFVAVGGFGRGSLGLGLSFALCSARAIARGGGVLVRRGIVG